MDPIPADTLRVIILPLDESRTLAAFLLSLVAALATPKEMTAP